VTAPTLERLDSLLAQLDQELDEAPAGVRVTREWKSIGAVVKEHAGLRAGLIDGSYALDSAIRTLEAQRDLLALTRDEVAEKDRAAEIERQRREREDRQIIAIVRKWLPTYSVMAVSTLVLVPALGLPFGAWCLLGVLPAALGFLEMRRRTQLMEGRSWVVLNDEVRAIDERTRIYHAISAVGVAMGVVWFLALAMTVGVA
jgi:hypothetical protein